MERKIERIDGSHDRCHFICQGTHERDAALRYFPDPMPKGYALHVEWTGPMSFTMEPRPVEQKDEAGNPITYASSTDNTASDGPTPRQEAAPALDKLSDADLDTRAAEVGVAVKEPGPKGKRFSRAKIVADVAAKLAGK